MNDLVQNPKGAGNAGASSEAKIDSVDQIEAILSRTLFNPIHDMAEHPSQHSSIEFVQAGFYLSSPGSQTTLTNADAALCANLAGVLETIHSGLIIIDDIQNDCAERKGIASFHKAHGLPVALNAGNWLHFQPFESIESLGLPPDKELLLYRACHEAMLKVHLGQALDLGAHLDQTKQSEVSAICMASLRLKAGALTSLAFTLGACAAGTTRAQLGNLNEFGTEFGVALQMFNEIGTFKSATNTGKCFEVFRSHRPSWLWACAAETSSDVNYRKFLAAVSRLTNEKADEKELRAWVDKNDLLEAARAKAVDNLESVFERFGRQVGSWSYFSKARAILNQVAERTRSTHG